MTEDTTTLTASDYELRELRAQDEHDVLQLLTASLAGGPTGERSATFLHWKHRANPFGTSPGLVAVAPDGTLAAVRLFLRWQFAVDGVPFPAVRAVDTATHPLHRGRGLFRRLTLAALDTAVADAALVFNTPNSSSRPGYLTMGWQDVAALPIRLRVARPLRFVQATVRRDDAVLGASGLDSRLPRAAEVLDARADEVDVLLSATADAAPRRQLRTPRTREYLRWRYGQAPGLDYRAVVIDGGAGLRALGLGRLRRRGSLVELTLGEVLALPGDRAAARAVLRGAHQAGVDHVALHVHPGSDLAAPATATGYLRVPGRGLRLVVNARRPLPVDPVDPRSWALTLGDLEVF